MSHLNPGLISAYNSLTDKHLAGYFSNTRIRRHLQRAGLITRSGRIVPDKEYRHKLIQRAHQRHVRECLAQAIFHKVLEMERLHQIEIKRKLEEFARRERVHKMKVERSKRYEEDIIRILSPRPPTGARGIRKQHSGPEGEHSESSESPSSSRPNTAPGKMQRPVRLKPIHSNSTTASMRRSSPYRLLESLHENNQSFNCTMDKESRRRFTTVEASHGISPYCLPVINNFVTPVPPTTKRKDRGVKVSRSSTIRGRRLRPTTASSGDVTEDLPLLRSSVHQSRVVVNMVYFGKSVHLSHDLTDMRDEVKVFQQHCGGENLCVYKGKLLEGEMFQFVSRRHRGFPFSLTFFLNGLQVERLSSCCEFKHRKGSRLGGRHGRFGFSSVEGASPCYKCIIAMGLDKKPTPPPKRVREDVEREESLSSPKDAPEMETERTGEDAASQSDCETSQPQDMETQVEEETAPEEDRVRDDYEEDFEADDEAPAEDEVKEEKSPSPAIETEKQATEKDASETEGNEKDEDIKSRSGSSSSGSDQAESDAEDPEDTKEEEKAEQPKEINQDENAVPPEEKDEPNPEEAAATVGESAVAKDSDIQDSAGDSTEIDISDTSVPSGNENRQSDDTSVGKDAEKTVEESKPEEEQERAKSVQEKLAEAILKESQCSSEPELSDTSTEEEEDSTDKGPKHDNKDAAPQKLVTFTDQPQTLVEAPKCEESVIGEGEVAPEQEESSETEEQKGEAPHEDSESTKDEKVSEVEEDERASEKKKPEDAGESLHPVSEENVAEDNKTADPLEGTPTEPTDAEAAEKDEGEEEKTDIQHDETGQGGKSGEEDESSVSEPNKKADETADNAEAEAMTASETMEMKAESSEEQEALSHEEAPVADTERRRQEDGEDGTAASETEVTAEDSSSSPEGSGDTIVEIKVETSEENTNNDDVKEEMSGTEAIQDDNQQERCEAEERTENSVEVDEKIEEQKSEKEEQTHVHPDKTEKDEHTEEGEEDETNGTEDEGRDEGEADETTHKKENNAEGADSDTNLDGQQNEAEKILVEEDIVANEEEVEEPEKAEKDETSECVEDKNDKEESGEKEKGTEKTNEGENRSETDIAVEDKNDEAEKSEEDEHKAEQSEVSENKNGEESGEIKDDKTVGEGGEKSAITLEKSAEADLDKENEKKPPENVVESEDGGDSEAADGTKTTEEVLNDVTEAENVKSETERASNSSEKGEIDAENGEISTGAESKPHEDERDDLKAAENTEEVRQREEHTEDEITDVKELSEESGKEEDDKVEKASDTNVAEREAKQEDESAEKQNELTKSDSEPETSGVEMIEDPKLDERKGSEETEQDENGNKSNLGNEIKDSDLTENNNNVQNSINEVKVVAASSGEQSSAPLVVDLDDTAQLLDEQNKEPVATFKTEKNLHNDENAVGVDVSAADAENGADTEEASKASEEGASVLLKPQAQNEEANEAEHGTILSKDIPETLVREDNSDLVTNWVNVHQTSKYFETFVEPLEDLREESSYAETSKSNKDETQSAELQRSESPGDIVRMSEDEQQKLKDEKEPTDETKVEAVESDLNSIHTGDETSATQVEEKIISKAETEQSDQESANRQDVRSEEHTESRRSIEEAQDGPTEELSEENDVSKTKVESISGSHHSGASGKPESVPENQTEEKTTENYLDKNIKPTEMKDLHHSLEPEERRVSKSPEGAKDIDETSEKQDELSREVTEITDFTTSKSDDGSQEESHGGETQTKVSDGSFSRDRRDVQLIQDIKHTLSKDRLSSFSVDETLFPRSSYPLLTAARTESGH